MYVLRSFCERGGVASLGDRVSEQKKMAILILIFDSHKEYKCAMSDQIISEMGSDWSVSRPLLYLANT